MRQRTETKIEGVAYVSFSILVICVFGIVLSQAVAFEAGSSQEVSTRNGERLAMLPFGGGGVVAGVALGIIGVSLLTTSTQQQSREQKA